MHIEFESDEIPTLILVVLFFKFCTEHGSINVVICTEFQNDWTTSKEGISKRDVSRFS